MPAEKFRCIEFHGRHINVCTYLLAIESDNRVAYANIGYPVHRPWYGELIPAEVNCFDPFAQNIV